MATSSNAAITGEENSVSNYEETSSVWYYPTKTTIPASKGIASGPLRLDRQTTDQGHARKLSQASTGSGNTYPIQEEGSTPCEVSNEAPKYPIQQVTGEPVAGINEISVAIITSLRTSDNYGYSPESTYSQQLSEGASRKDEIRSREAGRDQNASQSTGSFDSIDDDEDIMLRPDNIIRNVSGGGSEGHNTEGAIEKADQLSASRLKLFRKKYAALQFLSQLVQNQSQEAKSEEPSTSQSVTLQIEESQLSRTISNIAGSEVPLMPQSQLMGLIDKSQEAILKITADDSRVKTRAASAILSNPIDEHTEDPPLETLEGDSVVFSSFIAVDKVDKAVSPPQLNRAPSENWPIPRGLNAISVENILQRPALLEPSLGIAIATAGLNRNVLQPSIPSQTSLSQYQPSSIQDEEHEKPMGEAKVGISSTVPQAGKEDEISVANRHEDLVDIVRAQYSQLDSEERLIERQQQKGFVDAKGAPRWNELFIKAIESGNKRYYELTQLSSNFLQTASTYGSMIIEEFFLKDTLKTVRLEGLGGLAGGQKFVVRGILFKVPRDKVVDPYRTLWLYGKKNASLECAMKAMGKELLGAIQYSKYLRARSLFHKNSVNAPTSIVDIEHASNPLSNEYIGSDLAEAKGTFSQELAYALGDEKERSDSLKNVPSIIIDQLGPGALARKGESKPSGDEVASHDENSCSHSRSPSLSSVKSGGSNVSAWGIKSNSSDSSSSLSQSEAECDEAPCDNSVKLKAKIPKRTRRNSGPENLLQRKGSTEEFGKYYVNEEGELCDIFEESNSDSERNRADLLGSHSTERNMLSAHFSESNEESESPVSPFNERMKSKKPSKRTTAPKEEKEESSSSSDEEAEKTKKQIQSGGRKWGNAPTTSNSSDVVFSMPIRSAYSQLYKVGKDSNVRNLFLSTKSEDFVASEADNEVIEEDQYVQEEDDDEKANAYKLSLSSKSIESLKPIRRPVLHFKSQKSVPIEVPEMKLKHSFSNTRITVNDNHGSVTSPKFEEVFVPMQALVDYRGFRLLAMPLLPINRDTLRVGSGDGGKTVLASDDPLLVALQDCAKEMHIANHPIAGTDSYLPCAGDVEGHVGLDSRRYLVDLGRALPPECSSLSAHIPQIGQTTFYRFLRPELLQHVKLREDNIRFPPVSPDAFSRWGRQSKGFVYEQGAMNAALFMLHEQVPRFAHYLANELTAPHLQAKACRSLNVALHRAGINCRHLGLVRASLRYSEPLDGMNILTFKPEKIVQESDATISTTLLPRSSSSVMPAYFMDTGAFNNALKARYTILQILSSEASKQVPSSSPRLANTDKTAISSQLCSNFQNSRAMRITKAAVQNYIESVPQQDLVSKMLDVTIYTPSAPSLSNKLQVKVDSTAKLPSGVSYVKDTQGNCLPSMLVVGHESRIKAARSSLLVEMTARSLKNLLRRRLRNFHQDCGAMSSFYQAAESVATFLSQVTGAYLIREKQKQLQRIAALAHTGSYGEELFESLGDDSELNCQCVLEAEGYDPDSTSKGDAGSPVHTSAPAKAKVNPTMQKPKRQNQSVHAKSRNINKKDRTHRMSIGCDSPYCCVRTCSIESNFWTEEVLPDLQRRFGPFAAEILPEDGCQTLAQAMIPHLLRLVTYVTTSTGIRLTTSCYEACSRPGKIINFAFHACDIEAFGTRIKSLTSIEQSRANYMKEIWNTETYNELRAAHALAVTRDRRQRLLQARLRTQLQRESLSQNREFPKNTPFSIVHEGGDKIRSLEHRIERTLEALEQYPKTLKVIGQLSKRYAKSMLFLAIKDLSAALTGDPWNDNIAVDKVVCQAFFFELDGFPRNADFLLEREMNRLVSQQQRNPIMIGYSAAYQNANVSPLVSKCFSLSETKLASAELEKREQTANQHFFTNPEDKVSIPYLVLPFDAVLERFVIERSELLASNSAKKSQIIATPFALSKSKLGVPTQSQPPNLRRVVSSIETMFQLPKTEVKSAKKPDLFPLADQSSKLALPTLTRAQSLTLNPKGPAAAGLSQPFANKSSSILPPLQPLNLEYMRPITYFSLNYTSPGEFLDVPTSSTPTNELRANSQVPQTPVTQRERRRRLDRLMAKLVVTQVRLMIHRRGVPALQYRRVTGYVASARVLYSCYTLSALISTITMSHNQGLGCSLSPEKGNELKNLPLISTVDSHLRYLDTLAKLPKFEPPLVTKIPRVPLTLSSVGSASATRAVSVKEIEIICAALMNLLQACARAAAIFTGLSRTWDPVNAQQIKELEILSKNEQATRPQEKSAKIESAINQPNDLAQKTQRNGPKSLSDLITPGTLTRSLRQLAVEEHSQRGKIESELPEILKVDESIKRSQIPESENESESENGGEDKTSGSCADNSEHGDSDSAEEDDVKDESTKDRENKIELAKKALTEIHKLTKLRSQKTRSLGKDLFEYFTGRSPHNGSNLNNHLTGVINSFLTPSLTKLDSGSAKQSKMTCEGLLHHSLAIDDRSLLGLLKGLGVLSEPSDNSVEIKSPNLTRFFQDSKRSTAQIEKLFSLSTRKVLFRNGYVPHDSAIRLAQLSLLRVLNRTSHAPDDLRSAWRGPSEVWQGLSTPDRVSSPITDIVQRSTWSYTQDPVKTSPKYASPRGSEFSTTKQDSTYSYSKVPSPYLIPNLRLIPMASIKGTQSEEVDEFDAMDGSSSKAVTRPHIEALGLAMRLIDAVEVAINTGDEDSAVLMLTHFGFAFDALNSANESYIAESRHIHKQSVARLKLQGNLGVARRRSFLNATRDKIPPSTPLSITSPLSQNPFRRVVNVPPEMEIHHEYAPGIGRRKQKYAAPSDTLGYTSGAVLSPVGSYQAPVAKVEIDDSSFNVNSNDKGVCADAMGLAMSVNGTIIQSVNQVLAFQPRREIEDTPSLYTFQKKKTKDTRNKAQSPTTGELMQSPRLHNQSETLEPTQVDFLQEPTPTYDDEADESFILGDERIQSPDVDKVAWGFNVYSRHFTPLEVWPMFRYILEHSLRVACREGRRLVVQALLAEASDNQARAELVRSEDHMGYTSLFLATKQGDVSIVRALIAAKAQVQTEVAVEMGKSPLHIACGNSDSKVSFDLCSALLGSGALVNVRDSASLTPLHYASKMGHLDVVTLLINSRADVNSLDLNHLSPLYFAIAEGHQEIARALLNAHADHYHVLKMAQNRLDDTVKQRLLLYLSLLFPEEFKQDSSLGAFAYPVKSISEYTQARPIERLAPMLSDTVHTPLFQETRESKLSQFPQTRNLHFAPEANTLLHSKSTDADLISPDSLFSRRSH